MAYVTAAYRFADWCEARDLALGQLEPLHVARYIEQLGRVYAPSTVKQNLAAFFICCSTRGGRDSVWKETTEQRQNGSEKC